jgi:predicted DNA-binding helix-hairpin-helix protein
VEELTSEQAPDLPLGIDPKLAWALRHPERFPVDLHTAPREVLLRLPGLGVRNVDRLLQVRRWHRVTLPDLARLRVPLRKIMPFIVTSDHRPAALPTRLATVPVRQGELFAPEPAVFSSQW